MSTIIKKVQNQFLRNIYNMPFWQHQAELEYQTAVAQHIPNLPVLSTTDMNLVETIKNEGVAITSLADLEIASTPDMFQSAKNLMPKIPPSITGNKNEFVVHASSQQIMEHPEIFLWGIEPRLINIVETYLGLPVAYHGAYFRRDIANQVERKSRLWHIDKEDRKVLKIFIYLHDMTEDTGPFQYISQSVTTTVADTLKYNHGYIQDATMQKFISPPHCQSCLGSAGTVVFAATGSIFHRGKPPVARDRFTIFFDYTSTRQKLSSYRTLSLPEDDLILISQNLAEQQRKCLFWQ
ncbi:hypothetical protein [Calothrix sp. PCC 7507]|uniref:hypothetical protein n=1 Tax=Calothrix sp. PCC 7507 TaxID=99598 RepID=UPI00029F49FD|nr:hypothetical protein [Calothrix sp. PCC 7507]AFY31069.1 hypothetical protein Cal7507_0579 [Calothrix sp. PCC 7507]